MSEPQPPVKPVKVKREDPFSDFGRPVEISGIRLPPNVMFQNGLGSVCVGEHVSTGFYVSGIVHRIALYPNGISVLTVNPAFGKLTPGGVRKGDPDRDAANDRNVVIWPSGALGEVPL